MSRAAGVALLALAAACAREAPPRPFDPGRDVGVVTSLEGHGLFLVLGDETLPVGTQVTVVWPGPPARAERRRVARIEPLAEGAWPHPALIGVPRLHGLDGPPEDAIGAGLLGVRGEPTRAGDADRLDADLDLDGDGRAERFLSCTSLEGVHVFVRSGDPARTEPLADLYWYLGYDVEPTCPGSDAE